MKEEMPEEGAAAPQEGGAKQGLSEEQAKQLSEGISQKAVGLMEGMQELGFVLTELGVPPEQLEQLAGQFNAFLQTIQGILGGGEESPAPEQGGNQPSAGGPGAVPYDQGMANAGKNKSSPMVG